MILDHCIIYEWLSYRVPLGCHPYVVMSPHVIVVVRTTMPHVWILGIMVTVLHSIYVLCMIGIYTYLSGPDAISYLYVGLT